MTNKTVARSGKRWRLAPAVLATVALALAGCSEATTNNNAGNDYPTRQIQYIIPYAPGGATDQVGRAFAERLAERLGQTVVPVNQAGGSGLVGATAVVNARADGYTLGFGSPGGMFIQPLVDPSLPTASPDKYTPIVLMGTGPFSLMVKGDSPYKDLDGLVDYARAHPGEISVATTGGLAINTFVIAAWADAADIEVDMIPFDGSAEGQRELLGGRVDALVASSSGVVGMIKSGEMRALAVSGSDPFPQTPDVPTFISKGYNVPFEGAYLTFGPKDMPQSVTQKLIELSTEIVNSDEWKTWCAENGATPKNLTGAELAQWITHQQEALRPFLELVQNG